MDAFVLGLLEVKVVADEMVTALVDGMQHQVHVKLAPALFLEQEGRLLEGCIPHLLARKHARRDRGREREARGRGGGREGGRDEGTKGGSEGARGRGRGRERGREKVRLTATGIGKGGMQLVGDTVKDRGGYFITVRVQHHHLDGPLAHGVALGGVRNIGSVVQAQAHQPHQHVHRVVVRQHRSCDVERGGAAELVGGGGEGGRGGGRGGRGGWRRWDEQNAGSKHYDGAGDGGDDK